MAALDQKYEEIVRRPRSKRPPGAPLVDPDGLSDYGLRLYMAGYENWPHVLALIEKELRSSSETIVNIVTDKLAKIPS
jgi:hypothetical protein